MLVLTHRFRLDRNQAFATLELLLQDAAREVLETIRRTQHDFALVDGDEAFVLEAAQHATHGLGCQAQVVRDVRARHHQVQTRGRIATLGEAIGQVQQEGRETFTLARL